MTEDDHIKENERKCCNFPYDNYFRLEQYPIYYKMEITNVLPTDTEYGLN